MLGFDVGKYSALLPALLPDWGGARGRKAHVKENLKWQQGEVIEQKGLPVQSGKRRDWLGGPKVHKSLGS